MKILNFGSINIDNVYHVDDFVKPGETKKSLSFQVFPGGKGLNQSVALARAGAVVYHAGKIGTDGQWLADLMKTSGVDTALVEKAKCDTGKAVIQVSDTGQNAIILYEGANQEMDRKYIERVLDQFCAGDILVLQNEINLVPEMIESARQRGLKIALNPSPANEVIHQCDLSKIQWLLLNEVEGEWMTGKKEPEEICRELLKAYPDMEVVLTLGSQGVLYQSAEKKCFQKAFKVDAVDTTGAGDTFTGYFLRCVSEGETPEKALRLASKAASIAVSRAGAAVSIPYWSEVVREEESGR